MKMIIQIIALGIAKLFTFKLPEFDPMTNQVYVRGTSHFLDVDGYRITMIAEHYGIAFKYKKLSFRIGYDNSPMPKPGTKFKYVFDISYA